MKWYVQLKSRHSFVRPTMNRRANAPMNAFNTNDRITDWPPASVTWISWWNADKIESNVWLIFFLYILEMDKQLTWYWNRWSKVWLASTKTSIIAIIKPSVTYNIVWIAIIWAVSSSGSHCVFLKPDFIFLLCCALHRFKITAHFPHWAYYKMMNFTIYTKILYEQLRKLISSF